MQVVSDSLYLLSQSGDMLEFWRSLGTLETTTLIKSIPTSDPNGKWRFCDCQYLLNGKVVFVVDYSIWVSDGTEVGTHVLEDINPAGSDEVTALHCFNGRVYFSANDGVHGKELWVTDGTESGTMLFSDLWSGTQGSQPMQFFTLEKYLYFTAYNGTSRGFWKTNGTDCQPLRVMPDQHAHINMWVNPVVVDDKIYFSASHYPFGDHLYVHSITNDLTVPASCREGQSITFLPVDDVVFGASEIILEATADSGLPVAFELVQGEGQVTVENELVPSHPGRFTIRANQPGNGAYVAAESIERSLCVYPTKPSLSTNLVEGKLTLLSDSESGNRWFRDGIELVGETAKQLVVEEAGTYSLQVVMDDCASELSDPVAVVITGDEDAASGAFTLYPTLADSYVYVDTDKRVSSMVSIQSVSGQIIQQRVVNEYPACIDISGLVPGLYLLKISRQDQLFVGKFVKY
jgi:ELWxxDGT repeat protein